MNWFQSALLLVTSLSVTAACNSEFAVNVRERRSGASTIQYEAVETPQTLSQFYSYSGNSYNGVVPVQENAVIVFLHRDTNTCNYGLVVVGHSTGAFSYDIKVNQDWRSIIAIKDDAQDLVEYDDFGGGETTFYFGALSSQTDGFAVNLPSTDNSRTYRVELDQRDNVNTWYFVQPDGLGGYTYDEKQASSDLEITMVQTVFPTPTVSPTMAPTVFIDCSRCRIWQTLCLIRKMVKRVRGDCPWPIVGEI